jgi:putative ABC transport system permease protein
MFRNLFITALRNFRKDKGYSLLNVLGLTIGISFSLLLIFYVIDELSYDKYHEKADRIYRVVSYVKEPENSMKWASTQYPLGPTLKKDYPEVEQAVRLVNGGNPTFKIGDKQFYEEKIFFADSNVFDVFTCSFIEGNAATALMSPNSIVITRSMAEKYFGKNKAVGELMPSSSGNVYKITAVIEDVPKNSHILFNALISASSLPAGYADSWGQFGNFTYALLKPNTDAAAFEKKLLAMYDKYMAPIFSKFNIKIRYGVQPITSIHLKSDMAGEPEELGSMSYIYILSSVAFFMLLIACINYMNMATARSARRAKEIGVRKVAGSSKKQLIFQFLTESVFLSVVSLILSIAAIYFLLPVFNSLSGKHFTFLSLFTPATAFILLMVVVFVGVVGGSYPAFYLSRFQPITVLKGALSKGSSNIGLRRVLVVTQFAISMIMLICTLVVYGQLKYMRNKDLGFNKNYVLSAAANNGDGNTRSKILAFQEELKNNKNVVAVSTGESSPGGGFNFNLFSIQSTNGYIEKGIDCYAVDENYFKTLDIKLTRGRNFTGVTDTLRSIIVNESMVKDFGWEEPIGKKVRFPGDTSDFYLEVVGVIKDFHVKSLYNPIAPLLLFYRPNNNVVQVRLAPGDMQSAIASVEKSWKSNFPDIPFQYSFLDKDYDSQYAADQKRGRIFTSFSTLTIIITCLGLLGLIAFTTEQRRKEISIRKVMGARTAHIVTLLARNFILLVGISCIIAFPIAYYFMDRWLEIFPYKEGLKLTTFLVSALAVVVIALITVSFHTVRVALSNPVKSLRTE